MRYSPYFDIIFDYPEISTNNTSVNRFKHYPGHLSWSLYMNINEGVIPSPVLSQFDYNKRTFLKIELSVEGMWYIIIQTDDDKESHQAEKSFIKNGECSFDLNKGARLQSPVF